MPELPDVDVFRRYLARSGLKHEIGDVRVRSARMLKGVSARALRERLRGRRLVATRRHGKHLLAEISGRKAGWLALHFGMTGFLESFRASDAEPKRAALVLDLPRGRRLAYVSQREFGEIRLAESPESSAEQRDLGPDVLDLPATRFVSLLAGRRGHVKAALTDQSLMAGLGNAYADEALFHARVHPQAKVEGLELRDLQRLQRAVVRVLETAIARQADPSRVPHTWLLPHREKGGRCPRCGASPRRLSTGGRAGWLCPDCQKKRR